MNVKKKNISLLSNVLLWAVRIYSLLLDNSISIRFGVKNALIFCPVFGFVNFYFSVT